MLSIVVATVLINIGISCIIIAGDSLYSKVVAMKVQGTYMMYYASSIYNINKFVCIHHHCPIISDNTVHMYITIQL